jgi:cytochrome c-type biogenesis protein CcmE
MFGGMPFYVGRVSLMFILMAFIALMGFIYLYNFNANATIGYELSRLEYERDKLLTVQEQNNIDLSKSQSLDYIKQSSAITGMVKAHTVEYVGNEGTLAVNY